MSERVLEIGAGRMPAIMNPGTIFTQDNAEYVALDVQGVGEPYESRIIGEPRKLLEITKVIMDASVTPLSAEYFDHVIYRSVFGAFTPYRYNPKNVPYEPKKDNYGTTWTNTVDSLTESYRVLKPGGIICIAEEDTPIREDYVWDGLARAGFDTIAHIPSKLRAAPDYFDELPGDPDWLAARGKYWGNIGKLKYRFYEGDIHPGDKWDAPAYAGSFGYENPPYILTATKPIAA